MAVKVLAVNWQDRTNPQAGGAEVHLHEIFGRLAAAGHEVHLLCSGYGGAASEAVLDEAIRLARWFGAARSPAFVNGILDRAAREQGWL